MWQQVKQFLYGMLYEQNEPGETRVIIAASFVLFALGTVVDVVLAIMNIPWPDYGVFAAITGGGAIGGKVADEVVSIVSGAPKGQMPGPKNPLRK